MLSSHSFIILHNIDNQDFRNNKVDPPHKDTYHIAYTKNDRLGNNLAPTVISCSHGSSAQEEITAIQPATRSDRLGNNLSPMVMSWNHDGNSAKTNSSHAICKSWMLNKISQR
ncbi:hypothetical protein SADUNF_Sadunf14G0081700 [Salix dunnii]|uniref:Uncharacterized protein n=1 Tax=Salix dunnii TaxID=1413687 RepID=A0A835MQ06_9ROSI|nr:hypothetical protein SADUNF_Sadunf14G0081700 [Salix dunnii]